MFNFFKTRCRIGKKIHASIHFEDNYSNDYKVHMTGNEVSIFHCVREILDDGYTITAIKEEKR